MKNKLTVIVAVLVVVGLMAAGPMAYAAMGKGDPMKSLGLTPEQTKKIEAQREASKASNKAGGELLKAKTEALHQQIAQPGVKRSDVSGLVNEVNAIQAQIFSQRIDGLFAMKETLTPEQYTKLQEVKKERAKAKANKAAKAKKQRNW